MDISHVLLSPKGRIGPRDFLRGLILLTGASVIVQALAPATAPEIAVLQYPMLWAYFCVFGKRLHDNGQTAWINLLLFAAFIIVSSMLTAMLMPVLSPQIMPLMLEIQAIGVNQDLMAMLQAQQKHAVELARGTALPALASFLICSGLLGVLGAGLPSDPNANVHGPATGPRNP